MIEQHETFWTLLGNAAHWQFELFLMFLFDVVIGLILWPFVSKHIKHHFISDELHGFIKKKKKKKRLKK